LKQQKSVGPGDNPYTNWQKTTALKKLRKAKHISAAELAKAIGVSSSKMSEVENGTAYVSPEHLGRIAAILETNIEVISEGLKTEIINKILKPNK
jgi:transcriptional regulator with XRE-family HTH domain